jgi:hypothetical protein
MPNQRSASLLVTSTFKPTAKEEDTRLAEVLYASIARRDHLTDLSAVFTMGMLGAELPARRYRR